MIDELLRLTVPLMDGEGSHDFLSRLAARNGLRLMTDFCADYGLRHSSILNGCQAELARLATLAGVPLRSLQEATITKDDGGYRFRGQHLVLSSLRQQRMVCAACLRDDIAASELPPHVAAHGRLTWRIEYIRTCSVHGNGLIEVDPLPGRPAQDFAASVRPHLDRLDRLVLAAPRRDVSELERYVIGRLDGQRGSAPFLDGLDLHVAARLCEVIGAFAIHGRGVTLDSLAEHDLYFAGAVGIGIAGRGEAEVFAFITDLARRYPHGRGVKTGPMPPLTDFRIWVRGNRSDAYSPVRDLVLRHLAECEMDLPEEEPSISAAHHRRDAPAGIPHSKRNFTGVRPRRMLPAAAAVLERVAKNMIAIKATQASENSPCDTLCNRSAALRLGCDLIVLLALQAYGLIRAVTSNRDWRQQFRVDDLDALLLALTDGAPALDAIPTGAGHIDEVADAVSCTTLEIIVLMADDALPWHGKAAGCRRLNSLLVREDEVRSALERYEAAGATIKELATEREMPLDLPLRIVKAGAMKTVEAVDVLTGTKQTIIPDITINEFDSKYVDIYDLAQIAGISLFHAKLALKEYNQLPDFEGARPHPSYYEREYESVFLMAMMQYDKGL